MLGQFGVFADDGLCESTICHPTQTHSLVRSLLTHTHTQTHAPAHTQTHAHACTCPCMQPSTFITLASDMARGLAFMHSQNTMVRCGAVVRSIPYAYASKPLHFASKLVRHEDIFHHLLLSPFFVVFFFLPPPSPPLSFSSSSSPPRRRRRLVAVMRVSSTGISSLATFSSTRTTAREEAVLSE